MAQTTLDRRMFGSQDEQSNLSDHTITASDILTFSDVGDSNLTKKDTVQGVLDLAGGGGYAYVSTSPTIDPSSPPSSLAFTNMTSGYDYLYVLEDIASSSNSVGFKATLGINASTYRTSSYKSATTSTNNAGNSQSGESTSQIHIIDHTEMEAMGNGTNEAIHRGTLELTNPAGTADMTPYYGELTLNGENNVVPIIFCGIYLGAAEAHTCIKFECSSGNIASGAILQYRRARS
tara:strand:+ start:644 stop:1345 length:702 start_codon:yes stop_codon:yes gene_type:complete